ncbi:NDP-glycosyltransferase YjiC-like [Oppia nitens]|uniref:NDP-glycosyltransferase YjiC-like n=1 Tax=Oppia nitens TaxID=1686743 RepID=UPI0023DAC1D5|nr:NDP-glycosyltransferase YjiC-like [Oppia nitens]
MTKQSLKVLFIPVEAVGHVNAAVGIAQVLIGAGHRALFAIGSQWTGRLVNYGIEEIILQQQQQQEKPADEDPAKYWSSIFVGSGGIAATDAIETLKNLSKALYPTIMSQMRQLNPIIEKLLPTLEPDLIILDQVLEMPAVVKSGIPWIHTCSFNPLMAALDEQRLPPPGLGLPSIATSVSIRREWETHRQAICDIIYESWSDYNDYIISHGLPPLQKYKFMRGSPYLNIYGYPVELDYLLARELPPKWYRFDNLKRTEQSVDSNNKFEIPEQLMKNKSGKLIYFSMGSMGAADVENMKRLLAILGRTRHRYIVSKGPKHDDYDLPGNMWGQSSVPQTQVLPLVDLVITHGGNNTVTETFYFGKPMIVLPLFGDQYDNAQRVHEKGYGIKLDAYLCNEYELFNAIECLINDKQLQKKLGKISERIQQENSIGKLPEICERLVNNNSSKLLHYDNVDNNNNNLGNCCAMENNKKHNKKSTSIRIVPTFKVFN